MVIELESHGRNLEGINVSRTIGWFTAIYPVKFVLNQESLKEQIKYIKEQIRSVPNNGINYGILKYIKKAVKSTKKISEIRFNYLGQFDREVNNDLYSYSSLNTGSDIDLTNSLTSQIEFNCMIINSQLEFTINYNIKAFKKETIEHFAESYLHHLNTVLNHIRNENDVYFTPSDFDLVDLDMKDLNNLFN